MTVNHSTDIAPGASAPATQGPALRQTTLRSDRGSYSKTVEKRYA